MNDARRFSLVKPTIDTPFHIDFEWWKDHDNNWRVYLLGSLCAEHRAVFQTEDQNQNSSIDWVDAETAEVKTVDGLQHTLMMHCARQEGFVTGTSSLVDAVFRHFLAQGNEPMTPNQLAIIVNRPADTILRTLVGAQVYKGIRPKHN